MTTTTLDSVQDLFVQDLLPKVCCNAQYQEYLKQYITHWNAVTLTVNRTKETTLKSVSINQCSICKFLLDNYCERSQTCLMVDSLIMRIPDTLIGTCLVWLIFSDQYGLLKNNDGEEKVKWAIQSFNPVDIYDHFRLRLCFKTNRQKFIKRAMEIGIWFRHRNQEKTSLSTEMTLSDNEGAGEQKDKPEVTLSDNEEEEEDKPRPKRIKTGKKEKQKQSQEKHEQRNNKCKLKDYMTRSVNALKLDHSDDNDCRGGMNVPCIFGNTGNVTRSIASRMMPTDSRQLIGKKWYSDYLEPYIAYATYRSNPALYRIHQAGVITFEEQCTSSTHYRHMSNVLAYVAKNANSMRERDENMEMTPVQSSSSSARPASPTNFTSIRSFHSLIYASLDMKKQTKQMRTGTTETRETTTSPSPSSQHYDDNNNYDSYSNIILQAQNFVSLEEHIMSLVNSVDNEMSPIRYLELLYKTSKCVWCNMSLIPEIRASLNDLTHMARIVTAMISATDNEPKSLSTAAALGHSSLSPKESTIQLINDGVFMFHSDVRPSIIQSFKTIFPSANNSDYNRTHTYGFDCNIGVTMAAFAKAYEIWRTKYEFFDHVLQTCNMNYNEGMDSLFRHCIPSSNLLLCQLNTRCVAFETDIYAENKHLCTCSLGAILRLVSICHDTFLKWDSCWIKEVNIALTKHDIPLQI